MHVVISAIPFDPLGWAEIEAEDTSMLGDVSRRVNRVATLDGGVAINDFGYSDADRTVRVQWLSGDPGGAVVRRMMRLYPLVHLALEDGVFSAALENIATSGGVTTLTALITARVSE